MPKYLYHGSALGGLDTLEPRPSRVIGNKKAVFATPKKWAAIAFAARWRDSDMEMGTTNGKPYLTEQHAGAFHKVYAKGGWLYTVENKGFKKDKRLMRIERVSKVPVKVIKKEYISDPLTELERLGVKLTYYADSRGASFMERQAANVSSHLGKIIWRGKMSKLTPQLQKKFARRAPRALKGFSVRVPSVLDPQLRVIVVPEGGDNSIHGEVDTETGVIFINITDYAMGRNLKGNTKKIKWAVKEMDNVLWHEYVHYLQLSTKLIRAAGIWESLLYRFKNIFQSDSKIYYTNSIEQHAYIEEIKYMRDSGKSEKEIRVTILARLIKTIDIGVSLNHKELKTIAKSLLKKDQRKFVSYMTGIILQHYPKGNTLYGRYQIAKGLQSVFSEMSTIVEAYNTFFKMMDYQSRNPKLRWYRPLVSSLKKMEGI